LNWRSSYDKAQEHARTCELAMNTGGIPQLQGGEVHS
jgi:hypothetical protein